MEVSSQSHRSTLNFNIQLLSGKNVVLVNCPGYESELFMPQIVKGRISFQNIIPNRRCCEQANLTIGPLFGIGTSQGRSSQTDSLGIQRSGLTSTPLSRSAPSSESCMWVRTKGGKENMSPPMTEQLSPDQLRCKSAEVHFSDSKDLGTSHHLSHLEKSFSRTHLVLPSSLLLADKQKESDPVLTLQTPDTSFYSTSKGRVVEPAICNFMHKAPPARTYARDKPNSTGKAKSTIIWSPLQKKRKASTVSSTKAPNASKTLEVRHRKLIVDNQKSLGSLDLKKMSVCVSKKKITRKQVTGKSKKQFEALKTTAFDLLSTPGHRKVSKTLYHQFQLTCIDKSATTLPNYAEVAATRPLIIDREVKSLISKQKRLESTNSKPKVKTVPASQLHLVMSKRT